MIAHHHRATEGTDYLNAFTRASIVTNDIARAKEIGNAIRPTVIKNHVERI